ncbi:MAG: MATE family efflux transporter [Clostridia bacterium]
MDRETKLATQSIPKLLISLAIPSILAQLVNIIYNMVDRIYIGRMADGTTAMSALAVSLPVVTIIMAFTMLVGTGGAPLTAIKLGQQDKDGADKVLTTSFVCLIISAVTLTVIILIFAKQILYLFGANDSNIVYATQYVRIYAVGTIFVHLSFGLNAYITSQGFAKFSMATILIGAILNIILDPIFIFVFDMGVSGAALATILAQGISAIWVLKFFFSPKTMVKIKRKYLKPDPKIVFSIVALGISPFVMYLTESLLQISYNNQLSLYGGTIAVSSYTILISTYQMLNSTVMGFSQGASPILSYNYGAGLYSRVRATFKLLIIIAVSFSLIFTIFITTFPEVIAKIFTNDADNIAMTAWAMSVYFMGSYIYGAQNACQQCFLALGQAKRSLSMALFRKVVLLIPLVYILPILLGDSQFAINFAEPIAHLVGEGDKVFAVLFAEAISDCTAAIVTFTLFMSFYRNYLRLPDKEWKR